MLAAGRSAVVDTALQPTIARHISKVDQQRVSADPGRKEYDQSTAGPSPHIHPSRGRERAQVARKGDDPLAIRPESPPPNLGYHAIEGRLPKRLGPSQRGKIRKDRGD